MPLSNKLQEHFIDGRQMLVFVSHRGLIAFVIGLRELH
jgi:hypothetical protein